MNVGLDKIRAIEEKVLETLIKLESIYGKSMPIPKVVFKQLGRRLGTANFPLLKEVKLFPVPSVTWTLDTNRLGDFKITLNPDYFTDNWDETINDTVPHEIAHVASVFLYGYHNGGRHGRCWKSVMINLGLKPNRCASKSIDMTNVKCRPRVVQKNYGYQCGCPPHKNIHFLSKIRHNRFMSGKYTSLRCRRCGQQLKYIGTRA